MKRGNIRITPRAGETPEILAKRFKKRVDREGILGAYRDHAEYHKPSERRRWRRRREKARAEKRLKLERLEQRRWR